MTQDAATQRSFEKLIGVEPVLGRVDRLAALLPDADGRTLFHAGPPFASFETVPPPVKNAAAAAAMHEGLAETRKDALAAIASGSIRLAPAQDAGLVTPLAFVVGPSLFCLEVVDANRPEHRRLAPLNDGPLPDALRFGTGRRQGLALLAKGLAGGDDLHGHVASAQGAFLDLFGDEISSDARSYMSEANQFVLNVIMATAAVILGAGAGVADSNMVVAAGGNGVDFGYKVAGAPDTWITLPATRPQGPKFPGKEDAGALPAIGDSAVIDALGFGAACLRFCPTLAEALEGHIDPAFLTPAAHDAFVGPHPGLGNRDVRVGLDLTRPISALGVMLGMVEAGGIIGRGVAPWPAD